MGQTYPAELDADGEEVRTLLPLQAAVVTYRIAFGPRAGHKVLTLRGAMPRGAPSSNKGQPSGWGREPGWMGAKSSVEEGQPGTAWRLERQVRAFRSGLGSRVGVSAGV